MSAPAPQTPEPRRVIRLHPAPRRRGRDRSQDSDTDDEVEHTQRSPFQSPTSPRTYNINGNTSPSTRMWLMEMHSRGRTDVIVHMETGTDSKSPTNEDDAQRTLDFSGIRVHRQPVEMTKTTG